jgi:hypothetical protein
MHKDILTSIIGSNETPAFGNVEPLAAASALPEFGLWYCNGRPMGSCKHTRFQIATTLKLKLLNSWQL